MDQLNPSDSIPAKEETPPAPDRRRSMDVGNTDLPMYATFPHPVYGAIDFVGWIFLHGFAGGSAFHFVRGLCRGSPGGGGRRLAAGVRAALANAPGVAGKFAATFAVFSAIEGAVTLARPRDDSLNSVAAGAATWGLHGLRRRGAPAAAVSALLGASGVVAIMGIDRAVMDWHCRVKDRLRQKRMADAGLLPWIPPPPPPKLDDEFLLD
ncbi:hypothetical protein ACP70R_015923 [Stipagrostis hirtigluma subsp. patula]